MKKLALSLSALILTFFWIYNTAATDYQQSINPIIGDISFVKKFGHLPNRTTNEDLRIKTHLEFVENMLRKKETPYLSPQVLQKRKQLLNHLHTYWTAGVFPRNYNYSNRRVPCFIDKDGNICAVGYLIEKSAGSQVAENINNKYKYNEISAMDNKTVNEWILNSGLTKEECAMIQPTYGGWPQPAADNNNHISPANGISSSLLGGINLSLNALNGIQLINANTNKTIPSIGLLTGTAQTVLGITMYPKETKNTAGQNTTNQSLQVLSMVNIGLGTTTLIMSTWNLLTNRTPKDRLTKWNVYVVPTNKNNVAPVFSFTKRF